VSGVDRACMAHDICFGNAGIDASVNTNSSIHLTLQQAAAASACNQTLYNAVSQHSGDPGASRVMFWLKYGSFIGILAPGTGVQ
jgi:hypothetical protein